ncbi:MAG: hypothetical protein JXN61_18840, partial [Sedimentisphaerales bacterium]|nr:hypothetical protein [Sedimentisphaerales bacterium]
MKIRLNYCCAVIAFFTSFLVLSSTLAGEDKNNETAKEKGAAYYQRTFQRVSLSKDRVEKLLKQALAYTSYAKTPTTVEDVLALSDEKICSLITDMAAFEQCRCPKCGSPDVQRGEIDQLSDWHISDPLHIRCTICKELYPNENYPENAELRVKTPTGKEQVYKYYRDDEGRMIFLTATARYRLNETLVAACRTMAELWLITKDAKYANKAIVIMNRFREVWPDIPVHGFAGNDQYHVQFFSSPPYIAYQVGKLSGLRKRALDLELIKAYDLLYESDEFEKMSDRLGYDVRAKIEEGFRLAISMEITELGSPVPDWMVRAAYCLKDAPTMHWAVREFFGSFCAGAPYCLDGQDPRGSGYHRACGGYVDVLSGFARGYSDPPGYADIVDGTRFDNLGIAKLNPKLWNYLERKSAEATPKFRFPNGYVVAIHNAWSTNQRGGPPLAESRPMLFPGFGHAILGCGKGENQIQAHLHFSGLWGHGDADMLNLILFAKGHEFLPDYGYCHQLARA